MTEARPDAAPAPARDVPAAAAAPLVVAALYLAFLGHRSDAVGHFLAGFGATLGACGIVVLAWPRARLAAWSASIAAGGALACIGGGACLEGSVFRVSIFDPIDFFNQSLGAVFAGLAVLAGTAGGRPSARVLFLGAFLAFATLGAGAFFAFR